jgi:DNA-binding transcriptional LysR family regulator
LATLQASLSGQVNLGVILTPSMTLVPQVIALTKAEAPRLNIGIEVDTNNRLLKRLKNGQLDFLITRLLPQQDESDLVYEALSEESECAVVRVSHPLLARSDLSLKELAGTGWVLSPRGSLLRHRFDLLFRRSDLTPPSNVVETTAMSVTQSLLQQTDFMHIMPLDIARHYVNFCELAILPIGLPCKMDSYGLILQRDRLLLPGANPLLKHMRNVAAAIYPSPA